LDVPSSGSTIHVLAADGSPTVPSSPTTIVGEGRGDDLDDGDLRRAVGPGHDVRPTLRDDLLGAALAVAEDAASGAGRLRDGARRDRSASPHRTAHRRPPAG
jgi:hypothetical protein